MFVASVFFLVLACTCQGLHEQGTGIGTITHDTLEELLNRQEAKWASMLKAQESKWTSILREEKTVWASMLRRQEAKWASLLEQERAEWASALEEQDTRLTSQLRQQEKKLLAQQDLLRLQAEKLPYPDRLQFTNQAAKISHQGALFQQQESKLQQKKHRQQATAQKNPLHGTDMSQQYEKTSSFTSHDVIPRSDDAGPLEAVVSHLSQQVTEMGADIQAFKTQTNGDMQTLKNSQTQQDLAIQDAQSSTFVHWGSSTCTNLSSTVYSGVVGGSWYQHTGAATNHLCLTMSPVLSDHRDPVGGAHLHGGEYQTHDSHQDKDPVCAVCRSTLSTTVMIPGTNVCTPGWHLQYSGFLMAGHYAHAAGSEYICVDSRIESFPHSDANEEGKLLYYTVTRCGSLPCTPYVNNKVVTCAVCSK